MATTDTYINQVPKTEYNALRIQYTSKDYANILDDLINSIPGITQRYNTTDENDVGMILIKMMSMVGDMLFYNLDLQACEVYPNSVTQRKNAATIYRLIGYKMKWYRSAKITANFINTYTYAATIPRFCTFTNDNSSITYTNFNQLEIPSNTQNNGLERELELVEGTPVTPTRSSSNPYPEAGRAWHSIYNPNYYATDVVNCRLYLKDTNIDQDHIIVIDNVGDEWELKENVFLTTDVGKFYEFGIDVNDQPYIQFVDYWENYNLTEFKIFYIKSSGESGQVYANTITKVTGNVWTKVPSLNGDTVYNINKFIKFTHFDSTLGYDPETPDEARKYSARYQNTLDTIITLADFERAVLREDYVANVRATDLTNDPGIVQEYYLGDLNQDKTIDYDDYDLLENHLKDSKLYPLTEFQTKLADVNQDGVVDQKDLECIKSFLEPDLYKIGDINQDDSLTEDDLLLLNDIINNKVEVTDFQKKLADINQDGKIDETDLLLLQEHINATQKPTVPFGTLQDESKVGGTGISTLSTTELLKGFAVRLYVLPTEEFDSDDNGSDTTYDDNLVLQIQTALQQYKVLPLSIDVRLHDIKKFYWSVKGTFFTKTPMSRDELQSLIVTINNTLRHLYSRDKINFNTTINYKEVIETILDIDSRILMVDLEPIQYYDIEGNEVQKEEITGKYEVTIPLLANESASDNLKYEFTLPNAPILPGSVMIRVNDGQFVLRDNNNGEIMNTDNILARKGTIDYVTGKILVEFNEPLIEPMIINSTRNRTNIALYRNLSTKTFYFDSSSLEQMTNENLL